MPKMTWRQLQALIESDGWLLHHQTGSHRQFTIGKSQEP